ncbi:MAG: hypothetical protein IKG03_01785 [Clostridiales bacterium]|nr:hypothetical protein [Clostridiales bacterium]
MAVTELVRVHTAKKPDKNYVENPAIVKVAKLALILADKDTDIDTKCLCVKALEIFEYITPEEATQLLMYRTNLERFFDDIEDDEDDKQDTATPS